MAVDGRKPQRRKRYVRTPEAAPKALSPQGLRLLLHVLDWQFLSTPQLCQIADVSVQTAQRQMRNAFDLGLVDVVACPRVLLATAPLMDPTAALGSAVNLYQVTRQGVTLLRQLGLTDTTEVSARLGPHNFSFLRHEMHVRDCLMLFLRSSRQFPDHELLRWWLGKAAEIDLGCSQPPKVARPDAVALYRFGERILLALLEFDTGSERGLKRWQEKLNAYTLLLSGDYLKKRTGYSFGRVLVITTSDRRRDDLARLIGEQAAPWLYDRLWIAGPAVLQAADLTLPLWRHLTSDRLLSLISSSLPARGSQAKVRTEEG